MSVKWKAKAVTQKVISFLPYKEKINYLFQRYVTKGVLLNDHHFQLKLQHASDHISYYKNFKGSLQYKQVLELGTGWYPIVPIALYLSGADKIVSLDIQSWMTKESFLETVQMYQSWQQTDRLQSYLSQIDPKRWTLLIGLLDAEEHMDLEALCQVIGLSTFLQDARHTPFADQSFDFICSNNTFEHIYPDILQAILAEFKRLVKQDGLMSHFIDLSDHFAHFDQSITIYNFLQFSPQQWRFIDNRIQPQNRLRWPDYLAMYNELGLPITDTTIRAGDLQALQSVAIDPSFSHLSKEDIAISHGYIISQM